MKNKQKRILILTGIYPPDSGGPATFLPKIEKYLQSSNYFINLLSLSNLPKTCIVSTDLTHKVFIPRKINKIYRTILVLKNIYNLAQKSDLIFINGLFLEAYFVLRFLKRISIAKIVGDPVWEKAQLKSPRTIKFENRQLKQYSMSLAIFSYIYKKVFKSFNVLIFPSNYLKNTFINLYNLNNSYLVIHNSVPELNVLKTPNLKAKKYDLVILSRLVRWKNVDLFLKTISHKNYRVLIIGDGPEKSKLEKISFQSNLDITFTGDLSHQDTQAKLDGSKVFIQVSSYEGFSHSLLEAMSRGLICFVSNIESNREIINDSVNGFLVDLSGLNEISAILDIYIGDYDKQLIIGENAIRTIKEGFLDEVEIPKYIEKFDQLICLK